MCLIVIGWGLRADFPIIVGANRDEFFARPTAAAQFWAGAPHLLAGRDLEQGGTWLGVTRQGRLAAITNFRDGRRKRSGRRSRGWLVRDYLLSDMTAERFLGNAHAARGDYDGFNLIAGSLDGLWHYSSHTGEVLPIEPGVHGLSNHVLDTPWPKVERARHALRALGAAPAGNLVQGVSDLLADRVQPADAELPQTGVPLEWERLLGTAFIRSPDYGTRSSTVLLMDPAGNVTFEECTYAPDGAPSDRRSYNFTIGARSLARG